MAATRAPSGSSRLDRPPFIRPASKYRCQCAPTRRRWRSRIPVPARNRGPREAMIPIRAASRTCRCRRAGSGRLSAARNRVCAHSSACRESGTNRSRRFMLQPLADRDAARLGDEAEVAVGIHQPQRAVQRLEAGDQGIVGAAGLHEALIVVVEPRRGHPLSRGFGGVELVLALEVPQKPGVGFGIHAVGGGTAPAVSAERPRPRVGCRGPGGGIGRRPVVRWRGTREFEETL